MASKHSRRRRRSAWTDSGLWIDNGETMTMNRRQRIYLEQNKMSKTALLIFAKYTGDRCTLSCFFVRCPISSSRLEDAS